MEAPPNVSINWDDHPLNFRESFVELREKESFLDVTLVCDEDIQIKAHKNILAISSNFFENILRKNPHPHPMIYLRGLEHADLVAMVEFMYCGKVEVAQANLERFLTSAQELKVKGLFDNTTNFSDGKERTSRKLIESTSPLPDNADKNAMGKTIGEIMMANKDLNETVENLLDDDTSGIEDVTLTMKTEKDVEGTETSNDRHKNESTNTQVMSMIEKKEKVWHCKTCGKTAKQICQIKAHAETHLDGISVDCNICGKTYKSNSVLSAHKSKCRKNKMANTC